MNVTIELTAAEEAGLNHVVAKANDAAWARLTAEQREAFLPVTGEAYLIARVRDVLANYQQEVVRQREADNRALIAAALALPAADRDEITALIRSKLNPTT